MRRQASFPPFSETKVLFCIFKWTRWQTNQQSNQDAHQPRRHQQLCNDNRVEVQVKQFSHARDLSLLGGDGRLDPHPVDAAVAPPFPTCPCSCVESWIDYVQRIW